MMLNFLIIVVIVALAAWLGNLLMAVERGVAQARARMRSVRDTAAKLESTIRRHQRDEENLNTEIAKLGEEIEGLRHKQTEVQVRLADATQKRRPRLMILSDRRAPNDKEWLVIVANPQIGEIDAGHPLAEEWKLGREYLVWAETDKEAVERANRRFNARPGFSVRSVSPVDTSVFGTPRPTTTVR